MGRDVCGSLLLDCFRPLSARRQSAWDRVRGQQPAAATWSLPILTEPTSSSSGMRGGEPRSSRARNFPRSLSSQLSSGTSWRSLFNANRKAGGRCRCSNLTRARFPGWKNRVSPRPAPTSCRDPRNHRGDNKQRDAVTQTGARNLPCSDTSRRQFSKKHTASARVPRVQIAACSRSHCRSHCRSRSLYRSRSARGAGGHTSFV